MWNLRISFTFVSPVMGRINALRVETVSNTWCWSEEVGTGDRGGGGPPGRGTGRHRRVNSGDAFRGGLVVHLAQGLWGDWGMPEETWC